ncbi:MAG: dienelactone hydrolase family protein [Burkholderiales bacterium]
MERKKASDFPPEVLRLFDGYVHGTLSRRDFLDSAARFAVGTFTATAMLEALKPNFAWAQQVPKDDARIRAEYVTYASPQGSGKMRGYFARPAKAAAKLPGVVVIHENRGLNPYTEDVARRLAVLNFAAFAPDALTPVGGYPGDEDKARDLFAKLDAAKRTEDLMSGYTWLKARPETTKVGAVGFCFGGGIVNAMAVRFPDLAAAVPYYGSQPPAADVPKIKAALLIHYASDDPRINAGWPAFESALKSAGVKYEMHMYPNTQHAFHNDTTPRYDEAAAKLSWQRTVDFFNKNLHA